MRATSFAAIFALSTLAGTGCLPQVMHGPRVEQGGSGALSLSIGRNRDESDGNISLYPSFYGGGRFGWVPETSGVAVSLGAQVPGLLLPLFFDNNSSLIHEVSYADLYVQPRWQVDGTSDYGLGILASTQIYVPYFQYGRTGASGDGWFTTQGLLISSERFNNMLYYAPSVSWRDQDALRGRAISFFANGFVGENRRQGPADAGKTQLFVQVGVLAELGLRKKE